MTTQNSLLTSTKYAFFLFLIGLIVLDMVWGLNDCSTHGINTVPDTQNCACYFVCENGKRGKHECCDYGEWYMAKSDAPNLCVPVNRFPPSYQDRCFLKMKCEYKKLSGLI